MAVKPLTEALARQFGLKTTRKGGPEYVLPPDPTPEAMEIARLNAAKPVEEGGLGLPPDNTNVDRARAMGYGIPFYHGTMDEITRVESFRNKAGFFGANEPPEVAETYAFEPFAAGMTNLSKSKVYTLLMRDDALAKIKDPDNPARVGQVDWGGQNFDRAEGALLDLPNGDQIELDVIDTDDLEDIAEQYGLDAIEISNIKDVTGTGFGGVDDGKGTFDLIEEGGVPREMEIRKFPVSEDEFGLIGAVAQGTESVAYKPGLVRAPNAAFDPAQRGSPSLTASVDPITAGGILSLIASGGKEALDYLQQNLDPRTIADMGLMALASTPTPLAVPAAATESALLASDVINALRDPETRQQIQDFVTKEGTPSTSGQMKRAVNYQNGGPVDPQMAERNQGIGYFERQLSDAGLEPSQFEQDVTEQPGRVYDRLFSPFSRAETVPNPLYGEVEEPYEFDPAAGIMGMAGRGLAMFDRKLEGLPVSDEQLAAATLDLVGPSASAVYLKGASNAAPGTVAMFGAAEGLYTPAPIRAKAVEARSLKSQGATDKEVFEQTGIFPGLDKQLRFEIDDSQARLRFPIKFRDKKYEVVDEFDDASQEVIGKVYTGKIQGLLGPLKDSPLGMSEPEVLGDLLDHPELYKVYPFMKETPISALPDNIKRLAGFNPKGPRGRPEIEMNPEAGMYVTADDFAKKRMQETGQASKEDIEQDVVSVLLHEIQHYAQYVDDLNRGGNSKMFLPNSIDGAEQSAQFAIDFAKNMAEKNGFKFDSKLKRFGKSLLSLEREIDLLMRRQDPGVLPEDYALQEAKELKKLLKLQEEAKQGLGDRYDTVKAMESLLGRTESARDRSYELYKNLGGEIESRAVQERFRGNRSLKESPIDTLNLVKGKSEPFIIQRNLTTPDEVKIKQEVQELNDYLNTTLNNLLNSDPELIKAAGRAKKEHGDLSKLPSDLTPRKKPKKRSIIEGFDMMDPEGFADGGVVSLKDRAVNMTRKPRSNGIMQYVPYITGATNGY